MCDGLPALPGMAMAGGGVGGVAEGMQAPHNGGLQEVEHVRSVFPETWLWTNASVR